MSGAGGAAWRKSTGMVADGRAAAPLPQAVFGCGPITRRNSPPADTNPGCTRVYHSGVAPAGAAKKRSGY